MTINLLLIFAAFLLSLASVDIIRRNKHLIDTPNDRSSHTQPTPRGGGIGFVLAFAITSAITALVQTPPPLLLPLWLTLTPLAAVGFLDDVQEVPAAARYFVQLIVASVATVLLGTFPQPWLTPLGISGQVIAAVLTVIGFTAIINFYNFMDGLDGLVAGCAALQLSFLALFLNQPICWLLVAALIGFLRWNWSPAKIFMGDTGSTVLGASVAILLLNHTGPASQAWTALAITLPITADATYTIIRRLLKHENIFRAHRQHIFQRLHQANWTHSQVSLAYIGITTMIAVLILLLGTVGAWLSLFSTVLAVLYAERHLSYVRQRNC